MKKYIFCSALIFIVNISAFAQSPNWTVDENKFQYTMSFVSFLSVNGNTLANTNDKIAAFVNGICRGVTNLSYIEIEDSYYAFLTIFANANGETLIFKIYDSSNDKITEIPKIEKFKINGHFGDLFQSYSFAQPALSKKAEILDFSFNKVTPNEKRIEDNQISFSIDKNENIENLNAVFELSPGAKLYLGSVHQYSGANSIDFTNPVNLRILSEDRSTLSEWTITVRLSYGQVTYYKKDAVCYAGGAIKVLFSINGEDVLLEKDGTLFATQTITDGETIFSELDIGTYKIKVGGNAKEVEIILKN